MFRVNESKEGEHVKWDASGWLRGGRSGLRGRKWTPERSAMLQSVPEREEEEEQEEGGGRR